MPNLHKKEISMKNPRNVLLLAIACAAALPAAAQFRKPEDAVKYRQSVMTVMGNHMYGRLGAMANGRMPYDPKAAAENADLVVAMSRLPWNAFGPGTNVGMTEAKPAVWTETAKFKDLSEKMQAEVLKLQAATRNTPDYESFKTAYRAASSACKSCHDSFTNQ
jgi:cytochrome c556